jgi:coenzyme F420-reducing hydrogenase delta subunit
LGPLEGVVFQAVECAGLVSEALIMDSLASGAKGVLILGCHPGNCKSKSGTDWAGARVANSLGILNPGGDPKGPQISYRTLASNEKARLPHIINEFKASIK